MIEKEPSPSPLSKGEGTCNQRRLRKRLRGGYRYVRLRWRVLFAMIDYVGAALFRGSRAIRRWGIGSAPEPLDRQEDPRVILLVQLDHLGDAILTTAVLPALRRRYPKASIEVLAGAWNREVFDAAAEVDRVHVSQVNRFARRGLTRFAWIPATLWWGWRLRRRKVDLGIDVRGDFPVAVMLWLCGARRRLGWRCGGGGFLLTAAADFVPNRPEVESRWALLAELGIRPPETADTYRPSFRPGRHARRKIARRLAAPQKATGGPDHPLVVLHVGAGTPAKRWPVEHWRELLGRILLGHRAQVVLVGGDLDRIIAAQILGRRPWPGVTDWTGRLSLPELAALLEQADLLVGADSGPAHLAAAVNTPGVVLFSGTNDPRQWQPCGSQVTVVSHAVDCSPCHRQRCPRADHPCMNRLPPRRVAAEVQKVLGNVSPGRLTRVPTAGTATQQSTRLAVAGTSEAIIEPFSGRRHGDLPRNRVTQTHDHDCSHPTDR